jgi:integrase/recombinase XerC
MRLRGAVLLTPTTSPIDDQHLAWLRVAGRRPLTIKERRAVLRRLARDTGCLPSGVTAEAYTGWAAHIRSQVSDQTWRKIASHARAYYAWLIDVGLRTDDPTRRVPMPPAKRRVPRPVPDRVIVEAMAAADDADRAIIALMRLAGLRAAEVAGLAWHDVDLDDAMLLVREGKGGHQREVPMDDELVKLLTALSHRSEYVICRRDGGRGPNLPSTISKRVSAALGPAWTGHQLRHSFGTTVYRETNDIRTTQILLGHQSLNSTQIYVKARTNAARAAVEAARLQRPA